MKQLLSALMLVLVAMPACSQQPGFDIKSHVQKTYYRNDAQQYNRALKAGAVRYCGEYVMVDRGAAIDLPIYYLNAADGSVHSACGGACWRPQTPAQTEQCKTQCPPPGAKKCHVKQR